MNAQSYLSVVHSAINKGVGCAVATFLAVIATKTMTTIKLAHLKSLNTIFSPTQNEKKDWLFVVGWK